MMRLDAYIASIEFTELLVLGYTQALVQLLFYGRKLCLVRP